MRRSILIHHACIAVLAIGIGCQPTSTAPTSTRAPDATAPAPPVSTAPSIPVLSEPLLLEGVEEFTLLGALASPDSADDRAVVIDEIGRRRVWQAIPMLIRYLDDGRALMGSDNWVGGHAGNALRAITGQALPYTRKAWEEWWAKQPHGNK